MPESLNAQFKNFTNHHLWDDLSILNPLVVEEQSGAVLSYVEDGPIYTIRFLDKVYRIDMANRTLVSIEDDSLPDYQTNIVILTYLRNSGQGLAPGLSGMEISPHMLPSGDLFFRGPHELMQEPVAKAYGKNPQELLEVAMGMGAIPHRSHSFRLRALPFVEVYCYIEPGDDEFEPEVRFNFDSNIHYYLQLDGIFALVNCLASRLLSLKKP